MTGMKCTGGTARTMTGIFIKETGTIIIRIVTIIITATAIHSDHRSAIPDIFFKGGLIPAFYIFINTQRHILFHF